MQFLCPVPKQCQAGAGGSNLSELRTQRVPSLRSSPWPATPKAASGSTGTCYRRLWVVEIREPSLECIGAWWASLMVPPRPVPTGGVMRHHCPATGSILTWDLFPSWIKSNLKLATMSACTEASKPYLRSFAFILLPWPLTLIAHLVPSAPDRLACCWPLRTVQRDASCPHPQPITTSSVCAQPSRKLKAFGAILLSGAKTTLFPLSAGFTAVSRSLLSPRCLSQRS